MSFQLQITDYGSMDDSPSNPYVADIITLADAKNYLKQDYSSDTAEDTLIKGIVQAARRWVEQHIDQSIIKKQVVAYTRDELDQFSLPLPPVYSISEVLRINFDGTETELVKNTGYYEVGLTDKELVFYKSWATSGSDIAGIKVTYLAYMNEVNETLKDVVRGLVEEMYYNRGETSDRVQKVPFDVIEKLKPFRRLTL